MSKGRAEGVRVWGTEGYERKDWEGVKDKLYARLLKWKWLLPQLPYRVLVTNNLVALILCYRQYTTKRLYKGSSILNFLWFSQLN